MPADPTFSYTDTVNLDAEVSDLIISGFAGGGFSMRVIGKVSTEGAGGIKGAKLNVLVDNSDDLDDNGTGDLMDAFNAAKAELGITLSAAQFRDLLLRTAQIGVVNKAAND